MTLIGPLDRRLLVRRCKACQRRKIKCSMSTPCAYCVRSGQLCEPAEARKEPKRRPIVFVHHQTGPKAARNGAKTPDHFALLAPTACHVEICKDSTSQLLSHFFGVFLVANDFSSAAWDRLPCHLNEMLGDSNALKDIAIALAALDRSRMPHSAPTAENGVTLRQKALSSYSRALQEVRTQLMSAHQPMAWKSTLWVTFLLGLFELMVESTETNWERHFLYGTSYLLRMQGPGCFREGRGRDTFLSLRIFEISRALIYSDATFLAEPEWVILIKQLREEAGDAWWPKEAMYDLMLSCSVLFTQAAALVEISLETSKPFNLHDALPLVVEGTRLRQCLADWLERVEKNVPGIQGHSEKDIGKSHSLLLALIYYHALSIFLSGIYDYRLSCFPVPAHSLPILSRDQVEYHLSSVLALTKFALEKTKHTGVAFLFPVRVAAARSWTTNDRNEVLTLLRIILSKGFTISNFFHEFVQQCWVEKDSEDCPPL